MLARAHAGHISIREAADLCDLGRGAWTNWEKGARPYDKQEIAEIVAEKLGVNYDWLLNGGALEAPARRPSRRTLTRSVSATANPALAWPAVPPREHIVRTTPDRPIVIPRRDPVRPVSSIPASRRRPVSVRPAGRPMVA